jgi:calcineurin-like phosphoesterase
VGRDIAHRGTGCYDSICNQAVQDSVKTWLNGVPATDTRDAWCRSGLIGFQLHGSKDTGKKVRWRNIRIKELD